MNKKEQNAIGRNFADYDSADYHSAEHKTGRKSRKHARIKTWKAAAAAAALCAAVPLSAYAAGRYFGISAFFSQLRLELTDDANQLIETDIAQTTREESGEAFPVSFTVQEALCDSGSVNIVIEAQAAEKDKYLLVTNDCTPEDNVADIGIQGEGSLGDYAKSKGLEILYVSSGFQTGSPFFPASCSRVSKSVQDGTLDIFLSADRAQDDTDLDVIMTHTIRPASAEDENDVLKTSTSFALNDASSSLTAAYHAQGSLDVPGTEVTVTNVSMEKTELRTYVKIYYTDTRENMDNGLYFRIKDSSDSKEWPFVGGGGIERLDDNGGRCLSLTYEAREFPEKCVLEAYDCMEKQIYGQMELVQVK